MYNKILFLLIFFFLLFYLHNTYINQKYELHEDHNIPIFIISFNQYTYVKDMVEQLLKYTNNIYIIDNKSTYPPLVNYLKSIENKVNVLYMPKNYGHRVYLRDEIQQLAGDKYIITDPDLFLNKNLPKNFIEILSKLSNKYKAYKVGFALNITNNINDNIKSYQGHINFLKKEYTIKDWESRFWQNRIPDDNYELYNADLDTTFVLFNKRYNSIFSYIFNYFHIRVAGDFTCVHRPWLKNYEKDLLPDELDFYKNNNKSSTWISDVNK